MKEATKYIEDCLSRRVIFFTGKGGTGKTTLAWATAIACRRRGRQVAVAGWNKTDDATSLAAVDPAVRWVPLDTLSAFHEYALTLIKFEKVYETIFDNQILKTFILAAPGLSDTVIGGKIWDLWDKKEQDLILVDLPSSGHAVSFFQSPLGVKKVFLVGLVHRNTDRICEMFRHYRTRVDLVSLPEELPMTEARELRDKLRALHPLHFGFLHLNRTLPDFKSPDPAVDEKLASDIRACCDSHRLGRQQEAEALEAASALELPINKIPRLPLENRAKIIYELAEELETL